MEDLTLCDIRYPILLLDADRTLFDFEASQANALKTAYEAAGFSRTLPYTPEILDCYSRINQSWWQRLERNYHLKRVRQCFSDDQQCFCCSKY